MANRQYKDSVFRMFMNNPVELAKFYQAIRPDTIIRPEDIRINTLEDIMLDQLKNDVSFTWKDQSIVLTEHQSTVTPNMPARMLIYASRLLLGTLADKRAFYRRNLVCLPSIHFYELYIGDDMQEDEKLLKLSDAFREKPSDLELICHVLNITYRADRKILENCQPLREYSTFVNEIDKKRKGGATLDIAIRETINYCIQHEIMQSFLERCKEEVLQMMTLQWDAEEARRVQEEEYQEELSAATAKSKAEGLAEATMKIIRNLLKKKQLSYKDIADSTDTTVNDVIRIAKESHLAY